MPVGTLTELLFIAILALILIGPKDLPRVMRTLGRWWSKMHLCLVQVQQFIKAIAQDDPHKPDPQRLEPPTSPPPPSSRPPNDKEP